MTEFQVMALYGVMHAIGAASAVLTSVLIAIELSAVAGEVTEDAVLTVLLGSILASVLLFVPF